MFTHLLRAMGAADLVVQEGSGLLLHGVTGERLVNHYSFYAAFTSTEEYRLIGDGRPIGSLPVDKLLVEGSLLIFGGRRWRVLAVDTARKVITLTRTRGGKAPRFTGDGPTVADRVRRQMLLVLTRPEVPAYLDGTAQRLLAEARATFADLNLDTHTIFGTETETLVLPWRGDDIMSTLALAFTSHGLPATADGLALTVAAAPSVIRAAAAELAGQAPPDPCELAALVKYKARDKYDRYLDEHLLTASFAAASLDVPGAWEALRDMASDSGPVILDETPADLADVDRADDSAIETLKGCGFAVVDVETTGLAVNRGDRIIEIAVVQVDRDGRFGDVWSTLVNPDRDPGPTHITGWAELTWLARHDSPTLPVIWRPRSPGASSSRTTRCSTCPACMRSTHAPGIRFHPGRPCAPLTPPTCCDPTGHAGSPPAPPRKASRLSVPIRLLVMRS